MGGFAVSRLRDCLTITSESSENKNNNKKNGKRTVTKNHKLPESFTLNFNKFKGICLMSDWCRIAYGIRHINFSCHKNH